MVQLRNYSTALTIQHFDDNWHSHTQKHKISFTHTNIKRFSWMHKQPSFIWFRYLKRIQHKYCTIKHGIICLTCNSNGREKCVSPEWMAFVRFHLKSITLPVILLTMMTKWKSKIEIPLSLIFREFGLFHFANRGFANCICTVDSVNRFEMKSTRVTNPIPEINNE